MQKVVFATSLVDDKTNFFTEDRKSAYVLGMKFLGAPNGEYAALPSAMVSQFTLAVKMAPLSLPPNAQVQSLSFGVYGLSAGTLQIATDPSFSVETILASSSATGGDAFFTLNVTPSLSVANGPLYLRMAFSGSNTRAVDAFVVYADYTVPNTAQRKDASGDWVPVTTVKRRTETGWVDASLMPVYTPPARFVDSTTQHGAIDASTEYSDLEASTANLETLYGIRANVLTAPFSYQGYTNHPVPLNHPQLKSGYKLMIDQLTKYPPAVIAATNIDAVFLTSRITIGTTEDGVGGVAYSGTNQAFVSLAGTGSTLYQGTMFDDIEFAFHHEFQHLLRFTWDLDYTRLEQTWTQISPSSYIGDDYKLITVGRQQGFVREYSRHSYSEDIADVHGMLMSKNLYPHLMEWIEEDPYLRKKVELWKGFLASKAHEMGHSRFYTAIHSIGE